MTNTLYKVDAHKEVLRLFTTHGLTTVDLEKAISLGERIHSFMEKPSVKPSTELRKLSSIQWCALAITMILDQTVNRKIRTRAFLLKLVESFLSYKTLSPKQATCIGKAVTLYNGSYKLNNFQCYIVTTKNHNLT